MVNIMKMKVILLVFACGLAVLFSGCVGTVDGRTRAGVPFKKDKMEGRYERSVSQVFSAAKGVLGRLGQLNSEDTINKVLYAKVDTRNVWVKVEELDPKVTRVVVQVRTKGGSTDIDLAAQVEKEIALALATSE